MLFASTSLVARIERAECRLLAESTRAVRQRASQVEPFVQAIAGGVATLAVPGSPLNKLAGLGFQGPLPEDELERIEVEFARRGEPLQVELPSLADPSIGALLTGRGYTLQSIENVLARALPADDLPAQADDIEVSVCGDGEITTWLDVVVTGFAAPDTQGVPSHESFPRDLLEQVITDMTAADGFMRYLAHRGGEPAGAASMRLCEGVAQLCGAATLAEHRRRGIQTAMLATRLTAASAAGCDVAVMTVQPGSKSHENGQRRGFALLYTRAVLVKSPTNAG